MRGPGVWQVVKVLELVTAQRQTIRPMNKLESRSREAGFTSIFQNFVCHALLVPQSASDLKGPLLPRPTMSASIVSNYCRFLITKSLRIRYQISHAHSVTLNGHPIHQKHSSSHFSNRVDQLLSPTESSPVILFNVSSLFVIKNCNSPPIRLEKERKHSAHHRPSDCVR